MVDASARLIELAGEPDCVCGSNERRLIYRVVAEDWIIECRQCGALLKTLTPSVDMLFDGDRNPKNRSR